MASENRDDQFIAAIGTRYLLRFEEDTLRERRMPIQVIVEFLGTFMLVTVAAGAGVINHYVGGSPISRAAAVIAPGADRAGSGGPWSWRSSSPRSW